MFYNDQFCLTAFILCFSYNFLWFIFPLLRDCLFSLPLLTCHVKQTWKCSSSFLITDKERLFWTFSLHTTRKRFLRLALTKPPTKTATFSSPSFLILPSVFAEILLIIYPQTTSLSNNLLHQKNPILSVVLSSLKFNAKSGNKLSLNWILKERQQYQKVFICYSVIVRRNGKNVGKSTLWLHRIYCNAPFYKCY